jgi:DNA-binding PucR family transcriptional regulator
MTDGSLPHGTSLDHLLDGIVGTLARLYALPSAASPLVTGVAILDPDDELRDHHDELVLLIGARGGASVPLLRAAAASGAAAVAVKTGAEQDTPAELIEAAEQAEVPLLAVRPQVRWDQLASMLRERLDAAELPIGPAPDSAQPDLFALAETTALVTGGIVSIEDAGNRVLAYSRSDQGVDELRRLSILGWQGPESYMAKLREWGVLDRLRAGEQVVSVAEHPELGIRPRLAVGVRAGSRYLGTIWVQQRTTPFAERAEEALIGASRLVAGEILRRRTGADGGSTQALVGQLLTGRANTDLVAGRLGLDPAAPALVIGFSGPVEPEVPARALHRHQVRSIVSVYATAYYRSALVAVLDDRVYAVLSGVRSVPAPERADPALRSWVRDVVEVARTRAGVVWWAGIGSPVPGLAGLPSARAEVDRVLDVLARSGAAGSVATISELRAELLLEEILDLMASRPELRHPGVTAMVEYDQTRGGVLVDSLLAYLDALGDVRSASARLHVHPNTLRHRLRRARALSRLDLDDPRERLSCYLQLLLASRVSPVPRSAHRPAGG